MSTTHFDGVTVNTQASVYFDGKCVSHGITFADGTKKSVGVVIMECVAGGCEYKLAGTEAWLKSGPGDQFSVPGNSSFEIRVTEPYHYICHFG